MDHAWIYDMHNFPPDSVCRTFAFFLMEFMFSQWAVILFSAIRSCILVVRGYKLKTGRFDWRLITGAFLLPAILVAIIASTHLLGRAGGWCLVDERWSRGRAFGQVFNSILILLFCLITFAYGAIWIKIQRTEELRNKNGGVGRRGGAGGGEGGGGGENAHKYGSSIKIMMIFVFVFVLQWWSLALFNFWSWFTPPPPQILVVAVFFVNFGGVLNFIAYTIIRRRLQSVGLKTQHGDTGTTETAGNQKMKGAGGGIGGGAYISTANETVETMDGPMTSHF